MIRGAENGPTVNLSSCYRDMACPIVLGFFVFALFLFTSFYTLFFVPFGSRRLTSHIRPTSFKSPTWFWAQTRMKCAELEFEQQIFPWLQKARPCKVFTFAKRNSQEKHMEVLKLSRKNRLLLVCEYLRGFVIKKIGPGSSWRNS